MVKIKGPLLSQDAHGTVANLLTYSRRKSGQQVRKTNQPLADPSAKQIGHRRLVFFIICQWRTMSDADKATWTTNAKAAGNYLSGYHYFLQQALLDPYTHHGLALYLPCNEYTGSTVKDLSGQNHHGTLKPTPFTNVPHLVQSAIKKVGNALDYNGTSQYLELPISTNLQILGDVTYDFLIRPTRLTSGVVYSDELVNNYGTSIYISPIGRISYRTSQAAANQLTQSFLPALAIKYQNIVVRRTGTLADIYINMLVPTYAGQNPHTDPVVSPITPKISRLGSSAAVFYKGRLDEICKYNRALSDAELTARYVGTYL